MRVLSLFSGVGGFDLGLEAAGMTTVFQCEIDKHARTVLDHHWPDVPKWDDVTTLTGAHILEQTGGVDVVAWGSPCQDLSLAGKRAGLSGERSGLFHQGIRIIKELRELSNGKYPTWSVWENVVGALSSNRGADFGEVLHEMDEAGACFSEWTVLDAQYFGVPPRRRRVFVTSCFDSRTAAQCPDKIFPVAQSLPRDSSTGSETREGSSGTVAESIGSGSEPSVDRPLIFSPGAMSRIGGHVRDDGSAPTLLAKPGDNFPAVGQPVLAFDTQFGSNANVFEEQSPTLKASQQAPSVTQPSPMLLDGRRVNDVRVYTEPVQTLQERMGTGGNNVPVVAQETYGSSSFGQYTPGYGVVKAAGGDIGGGSETLVVEQPVQALSYDGYNQTVEEEIHRPIRVGRDSSDFVADLRPPTLVVRRLTPLECERLMGWPDNHTAIGTNGAVSDTQRYKMCGNGVASPVAQWIAAHLMNLQ
jgi:DNA (cytosine-5)-methyltransferase 1